MVKKPKTQFRLSELFLKKAHWTQSVMSLVKGVRVETKALMSPSRESIRWSPSSCKCLWSIDFPIMSGLFSSTKSFPSLYQLVFGPGNAVDRHRPICLSVASFHRSTAIGRGGVVSGRKWAREQASKWRIIQCLAVTGEKAWQICPNSKPVGVG